MFIEGFKGEETSRSEMEMEVSADATSGDAKEKLHGTHAIRNKTEDNLCGEEVAKESSGDIQSTNLDAGLLSARKEANLTGTDQSLGRSTIDSGVHAENTSSGSGQKVELRSVVPEVPDLRNIHHADFFAQWAEAIDAQEKATRASKYKFAGYAMKMMTALKDEEHKAVTQVAKMKANLIAMGKIYTCIYCKMYSVKVF